ncbi:phage head morphogenesis protein [Aquincola tertiaricarbonis]|uniref:Phage head morphogenesis protein n=1 Tax=Aquincola tertiaricarbonis TaxID=391953 RepID=A0ABY4SGZ7_AQUTE|nr:phage minor head protein [Aquincola tertiaricarbonis]URI11058.1 phage head morphogenesis protein [Aquincola tertiaricarbonis]
MAEAFGLRFQEAIDNLRGKLPEASVAWNSLAGPVHAKVFTVAGATSADLAGELQQALLAALNNGTTIADFRKSFDQVVQSHGWTYRGSRGWRTSVIFDNNMRSAHMAGRWQQLQANKERRPFLQYRTAGDARVRPLHRQWNGRVYPIDDDFWQTHYPPNGWGCRCTVRAFSQADMDERNLSVSEPIPRQTRDVVNRDGVITDRVPVGIDPGWDHNVGRSWIAPELALGEKLARLPRELQGALVDKTISPAFQEVLADRWKAFRSTVAAGGAEGDAQVVGFLDSATLGAVAEQVPGMQLASTAVGVFDDAARAIPAGSTWPTDWVDELPQSLRNYQAVLWDAQTGNLVVVPQGRIDGDLATITLRPNSSTAGGAALSVQRLGTAKATDLPASRYLRLVGRIE